MSHPMNMQVIEQSLLQDIQADNVNKLAASKGFCKLAGWSNRKLRKIQCEQWPGKEAYILWMTNDDIPKLRVATFAATPEEAQKIEERIRESLDMDMIDLDVEWDTRS